MQLKSAFHMEKRREEEDGPIVGPHNWEMLKWEDNTHTLESQKKFKHFTWLPLFSHKGNVSECQPMVSLVLNLCIVCKSQKNIIKKKTKIPK